MPVITPNSMYFTLKQKFLPLTWKTWGWQREEEKKIVIIPWLVPVWLLWPHLEYVHEECCWKNCYWKKCCNAVMVVFLLPVLPAVVATKYLADCFMFLNRLERLLHLKKNKNCTERQFWIQLRLCGLCSFSKKFLTLSIYIKVEVWGVKMKPFTEFLETL